MIIFNRRFLLRDIFHLGLAQYSGIFFGFLSTIALTRILMPETYGKYSYIFSLLGFFVFLSLPGVTTPIMQAAANNNDKALETGTKLRIRFSVLGSLCLLSFAIFICLKSDINLVIALLIAALLFPFYICLNSYLYFLNGKRLFYTYFRYSFMEDAFIFITTILVAMWTRNFLYVTIGVLFSKVVINLILYFRTLRLFKKNDKDDPDVKRLGGHYSIINFMGTLKGGYFEQILIGTCFSFTYLAIYKIGEIIADQIKNLWSIIDSYIFPIVAKEKKSVARTKLFHRIIALLVIFILFGGVLTAAVQILIPMFFTEKYTKSIPIAQLLILSQIISVPGSAIILYCKAQKIVREIYFVKSVQIIFYLVFLLILVPRYKVMGVAWSIILSNLIYTLAALFIIFGKNKVIIWILARFPKRNREILSNLEIANK